MTILDRHVTASFLRSYVLLVVLGISIYIFGDLIFNIDEYSENKALSFLEVLGVIADFYGHNLPLYFSQIAGPALALAAAFTFGQMVRTNELTALIAAGLPLQRLAIPVLLTAVGLLLVFVVNREVVIPQFASKIARERDDLIGGRDKGVVLVPDPQGNRLSAERVDLPRRTIEQVNIIVSDPSGKIVECIEADEAVYDDTVRPPVWRLVNGRRVELDAAQRLQIGDPVLAEPVTKFAYGYSPEQLLLHQGEQWTHLLSLNQLNQLASNPDKPNLAAIVVARHNRVVEPLSHLVLLVLTIPFFLARGPVSVVAAGGNAVLVGALFLGISAASQSVVSQDHAALRAWVPILCFGPIAAMQLSNVRT